MYAKRVQLTNYGPIGELDFDFPFDGEVPKPVVLVGANGSGKSILLSHIVNGLVSAKDHAYPGNPEVDTGRVFKLRSSSYIKSGCRCSFGRIDFGDGVYVSEIVLAARKRDFTAIPAELVGEDARALWDQIQAEQSSHFNSSVSRVGQDRLREIFSMNCVTYFPANRFEEPAWLNEDNLKSRAEYMDLTHTQGYTDRKVINYSALAG